MKNIDDLDLHNNIDSLGQPINRFKLSFSNFPFLTGENADEILYMVIENNILSYDFPESSFNYIEDDVHGTVNYIPNVKYSLPNFDENNVTLTFLLDEFRFNYMLFFQWRCSLISKTRNKQETNYVESNNEYFIDTMTLDVFDNQGNPDVVFSLTFYNLVMTKLDKISTETDDITAKFSVSFRYEDLKFNIDKMKILNSFRNINIIK